MTINLGYFIAVPMILLLGVFLFTVGKLMFTESPGEKSYREWREGRWREPGDP